MYLKLDKIEEFRIKVGFTLQIYVKYFIWYGTQCHTIETNMKFSMTLGISLWSSLFLVLSAKGKWNSSWSC